MTPAASLLQPQSNPALYVSTVLMLYVDLPDTPLRASAQDQWLARKLHEQGVPLTVVESALLLASLRRLVRSPVLYRARRVAERGRTRLQSVGPWILPGLRE
jgi:hypothetical protein